MSSCLQSAKISVWQLIRAILVLTKYIKLAPFRLINELSNDGLGLVRVRVTVRDFLQPWKIQIVIPSGTKGRYDYHSRKNVWIS